MPFIEDKDEIYPIFIYSDKCNSINSITFDDGIEEYHKTELKESLVSRSYTEKINNISVTNDVELPKIPNLDDIHIAEELYCRGRLSSTKLTALKRTFNI